MHRRSRARHTGGAEQAAPGFTLPELLIVIALAAVLAVFAVPSIVSTIQTNRVDTAANQFIATLSMARSEAVKLGCTVSVTPNGPAPPGNWGAAGWTVMAPGCTSSGAVTAPAPVTLQNAAALAGQMTMYGSLAQVNFNSMGQFTGPGGVLTPEADFIFCADGVTATYPMAQGVTVIPSGRVRLADHPAGTPLENNETTAMTCTHP